MFISVGLRRPPPFSLTCNGSAQPPSGWLSGWLCGGLAGWLTALCRFPARVVPRLDLCEQQGPFLQLAAAGPGSYLLRTRNLGTELPYGSGMAYGRCDRVPLTAFTHQPTPAQAEWGETGSPLKKSTQWHAPQQRFRRQLHQSVAVAPGPWCGTCPTSPASPLSPQTSRLVKLEQLPVSQPDSV